MFKSTAFGLCVAAAWLVVLGVGGCSRMTEPMGGESLGAGSAEFQQRIDQPGLVLVKFGAPWCGPCRQLDHEIKELTPIAEGRVDIVMINVDDEPGLARKYQISSIPRLMLFRDGQKIHDSVGFVGADEMNRWITAANQTAGDVVTNPYAQ